MARAVFCFLIHGDQNSELPSFPKNKQAIITSIETLPLTCEYLNHSNLALPGHGAIYSCQLPSPYQVTNSPNDVSVLVGIPLEGRSNLFETGARWCMYIYTELFEKSIIIIHPFMCTKHSQTCSGHNPHILGFRWFQFWSFTFDIRLTFPKLKIDVVHLRNRKRERMSNHLFLD